MLNENYNNTGDWRSKLEALDNLPGETIINKNASWEKLHDRLREKRSSKKIIWYWSAAACLLLVLMVPLINLIKKDHEPVKTETAQKQAGMKSSPAILINKGDAVQIPAPVLSEKDQIITVTGKRIRKYQLIIPDVVAGKNRLAATVISHDFKKVPVIADSQPLNTS